MRTGGRDTELSIPVATLPRAMGVGVPQIHEARPRQSVLDREGVRHQSLMVADLAAAAAGLLLAVPLLGDDRLAPAALLALPLHVVGTRLAGVYDRDDVVLRRSPLDEAPELLRIAGLYTLAVWLLGGVVIDGTIGRDQALVLWGAVFSMTTAARYGIRWLVSRLRPPERCLVIGSLESCRRVQRKLARSRAAAEVVAALPLQDRAFFHGDRGVADMHALVTEYDVQRVIIAPVSTDSQETLDLIRAAKLTGIRVSLLPRVFEAVGSSVVFDELDGLTMLGLRRVRLSRSSHALKRMFDLAVAAVGLTLAAPVIAMIALAIKLDSHGPVLFRQTRVGRAGRRFPIIKFRSMVAGAEELKSGLHDLNEADGLFKISDDPRITRVGGWLRRTSLDELPQLVNVLRGEMSLVGPRPLIVDEDSRIDGLARTRLDLAPGMTGHWQVLGSSHIPLEEMVSIDYLYVANWSLWTDVKLLLRTVPHVLGRRGR